MDEPPNVIEIDDETAEEWLRADVAAQERYMARLEAEHAAAMDEAHTELQELRRDLADFLREKP